VAVSDEPNGVKLEGITGVGPGGISMGPGAIGMEPGSVSGMGPGAIGIESMGLGRPPKVKGAAVCMSKGRSALSDIDTSNAVMNAAVSSYSASVSTVGEYGVRRPTPRERMRATAAVVAESSLVLSGSQSSTA
jgi:hypothetical protein